MRPLVHLTSARVRGGLMRVLETLVAARSPGQRVAVISPLRPAEQAGCGAERYPIILSGNSDLGGLTRLLAAARRLRPRVVVHHAGAPGELALSVALLSLRYPVIVVEHLAEYEPLGTPFRDRLFGWLNRRADRWVSVSAAGAVALEARWRLPTGTLGVFHCGVAEPAGPARPEENRTTTVLGLGRTEARKGFDTFCQVAQAVAPEYPSTRWVWVGSEMAQRLGVVEVHPWADETGPWLRSAAMLLVPSRAEGIPLVVLEAMACGCPVVASRVGGLPEVLEDRKSGVLLDQDDTASWVTTVAELLRNPRQRNELGAKGRTVWQAYWTVEAMVARFETLVDDVVARRIPCSSGYPT